MSVFEIPIVARYLVYGPEEDRRTKKKSEHGKVAHREYWSG